MQPLIRALGSLKFAIILIAGLILILTASTLLESAYGTPFAQKYFYTTTWFDIFLGLFWINIFCATLTRWPFEKKHTGFVITHIGILLLLIGTLLSRIWGVEGQMTVFEGDKKSWIVQEGFLLQFWEEGRPPRSVALKKQNFKKPYQVPLAAASTQLYILQTRQDAKEKEVLVEAGAKEPVNHAIEVTLSSEIAGLNEHFWLTEKDAANPHSFFKDLGPAHVELRTRAAAGGFIPSTLILVQRTTGQHFKVEIDEKMPDVIPLGKNKLKITNLRYFPHARVVDRRIVDSPSDVPFNPAVEFEVSDAQGHTERHTKFFLFPDFESLIGGKGANALDLEVSLDSKIPDSLRSTPSPALMFYVSPDEKWSYEIRSSKKSSAPVPLKLDEKVATGWMDITFTAHQVFTHAKMTTEIETGGTKNPENFSVELLSVGKDGKKEKHWVFIEKPVTITTEKGSLKISLEPVTAPLPFSLALKDFRKIDYPGTQNPSSYESDVSLHDDKENLTIEKTIKMNKPLDYKGWRVFQASYIQDPESGEASVFSIAKNPGIKFIYPGAIIILIGVILLFYLHPFFSKANDK